MKRFEPSHWLPSRDMFSKFPLHSWACPKQQNHVISKWVVVFEYIYYRNMGHSKCQVTTFAHNDFKLVHSQTKVLVELVSRSKPRFLMCLLLTTGHFLLGWTGNGAVGSSFTTHSCCVFLLLDSQAWNRNRLDEKCAVSTLMSTPIRTAFE
jgi:hypothetical protein